MRCRSLKFTEMFFMSKYTTNCRIRQRNGGPYLRGKKHEEVDNIVDMQGRLVPFDIEDVVSLLSVYGIFAVWHDPVGG